MAKQFQGSWVILILIAIFTAWLVFIPAIIYYLINYKEVQETQYQQQQQQQQVVINVPSSAAPPAPEAHKKTCLSCGQQVDVRYTVCPFCNQPTSRQPPPSSF